MPKRFLLTVLPLIAVSSICMAAPEQCVEVSSSHFDVFTNGGEREGRRVLDQLERVRWVFRTEFPTAHSDPPAPIVVMAVKNQRDFQTIEPEAYLGKGQLELGGYFLRAPDTDYILLRLDAAPENYPYSGVYHEYTHSQFNREGSLIPLWLNEGLAQFLETMDIGDKSVVLGEASKDQVADLEQAALIPLEALFRVDENSPYYHREQKASVFYAESWGLTHYLMVNDATHKTNKVGEYIRRVDEHEDPVKAAAEVFGNLKKLFEELRSYQQQLAYQHIPLNSAAAPLDEASYKVRAATVLEAEGVRAEVLAEVGRTNDAKALVDELEKQDAKSVKAREVLATLAFRANDLAEAQKQYSEAVNLGSENYLDYYYAATLRPSAGGPELDEIASELNQVIRLNANYGPAYDALAAAYLRRRDRREKVEEAYKLETKAMELNHAKLSYRLNYANVLIAMGKTGEAEDVLNAVLKAGPNPQLAAQAQSALNQAKAMKGSGTEPRAPDAAHAQVAPAGKTEQMANVQKPTPRKHPSEAATGPMHSIEGVIRGVACSDPNGIEFRVEGAGKTVTVNSSDYSNLDVTAAGSLGMEGGVNPCQDFEGRTAWVAYRESSDKTVDGQVTAVEIRK